jgi:hypothetical protein
VELDSGTVYVWNGVGSLSALSQTWQGLGEFGVIDGLDGDRSLKAQSLTLAILGVPGENITGGVVAATRSERYQGRTVTIYGAIQDSTGAIVGYPVVMWTGFADVMTYRLGSSFSVSLTVEYFTSHLRRTNGLRMTTESHNFRLGRSSPTADDLFFEPQDRLMGAPKPVL